MPQVPLGEAQPAETAVGNEWCDPSAFQRGEAQRLLAVAPALGEGAERTQGPRQPRPGLAPKARVCTGRARCLIRRLDIAPQELGRPTVVADVMVYLPQVMGC